MAKIVHADAPEALWRVYPKSVAILLGGADPGASPARSDHVFHAASGMAALGGEYVPGMLTAKLLENRLSVIIEHYHPGALALDEIRRQDKHASLERGGVQFRDPNFPSPLEPTELLVSQPRVDSELCDPATVGGEFVEKQLLLGGIQRVGLASTVAPLGNNCRRALEPGHIGPGMAPHFSRKLQHPAADGDFGIARNDREILASLAVRIERVVVDLIQPEVANVGRQVL